MKRELRATLMTLLLGVVVAVPALVAAGQEAVVNINTAGTEQLMLLPRVGPSVAARIIEFREENGGFKAPEDLLLVRGVGEKTFELIEPHITLSGETTLTEKVKVARAEPGSS